MAGFVKVAKTNGIVPGQGKIIEADGKKIDGKKIAPATQAVARYNIRVEGSDVEVEV